VSLITDATLSLTTIGLASGAGTTSGREVSVVPTKQQITAVLAQFEANTADGGVLSGTNTPCVPQKENS
jgi:hypothetical protein